MAMATLSIAVVSVKATRATMGKRQTLVYSSYANHDGPVEYIPSEWLDTYRFQSARRQKLFEIIMKFVETRFSEVPGRLVLGSA